MNNIISLIEEKLDEKSIARYEVTDGYDLNPEWVIEVGEAKTIVNNVMYMGKNEHIIDIRKYATDKADEWFEREYETQLPHSELYEFLNNEELTLGCILKDKYNQIYMDKVDEIEEDLMHYIKDLNHIDYDSRNQESLSNDGSPTK